MNSRKAIEIQAKFINDPAITHLYDLKDAMKLGIEALKVIAGTRAVGSVIISPLLPGETED